SSASPAGSCRPSGRQTCRSSMVSAGSSEPEGWSGNPGLGGVMKYLTYIFRNARRNPMRSLLTIASMGICLFLMMILVSFFAIRDDVLAETRICNRVISMGANGFAGMNPISRVKEVAQLDGVVATSPFSWYGGKYQEEVLPFAQFGVDPETVFTILSEMTIPAD